MASDNPIAPTAVESLVITDTGASALVVGGATPTATTGTGGINAGPIVGTSVSDSVGTLDAVRDGGLTLASQAALDLMKASSASQWARVAAGTSLQYLRMNGGASDIEWGSIGIVLAKEGSGSTTSAAAQNVDTYALASTLTIKDALLVFVRHRNTGNAGSIAPLLYNSTDSVTIALTSPALNNYYTDVFFISAQATTRVGAIGLPFAGTVIAPTRSTFTTSYAGAWTLALRHGGVTAGDTWEWEWAVYRIAGQ